MAVSDCPLETRPRIAVPAALDAPQQCIFLMCLMFHSSITQQNGSRMTLHFSVEGTPA